MTFFDFQSLPVQEQVNILYYHGVYIGKRKAVRLTVLLYQLESFYVEVYYRKYRHQISSIRCSDSTSLLDPYLEQIEVEIWVT
jgi:hypothetical protein